LLPATENMPGGGAYKPGDVLRTMSGQTIEIITTDAEGRIILSDALAYACRYKPAVIVDIATLTGACVVALGQEAIGMLGTNDAFKRKIQDAGYTHDRDKHEVREKHHGEGGWKVEKEDGVLKRDYASYEEYVIHQKQKLDEMIKRKQSLLKDYMRQRQILKL